MSDRSAPEPSADAAFPAPLDVLVRDYAAHAAASATFTSALRAPFAAVLASDLVAVTLECMLRTLAAAADPPPSRFRADGEGVVLFERFDPLHLLLSEDVMSERGRLLGSPRDRLIGVLTGSVSLSRFVHHSTHDPEVLDSQCLLTPVEEVTLCAGDQVALQAWKDVAAIEGEAVLLVLVSPMRQVSRWIYDRDGLQPIARVSAEQRLRRVEECLQLLARIGTCDHAAACEWLLTHISPAIRREAIRTAYRLHHPDWKRLARIAAADAAFEVRQAAAVLELGYS